MLKEKNRCRWVDKNSAIYVNYHDTEWGVPVYEDEKLFEMLLLECFQAGLSWITILKKREEFRQAFDGFQVQKVAAYDNNKVEQLLTNPGIIRNQGKVRAAINNAMVFLAIQKEFGSFSKYIWGFTQGEIIKNTDDLLPTRTELSDSVSKDLKRRGMKYVGSVTIYSYLQAIGIVNDHESNCFRQE